MELMEMKFEVFKHTAHHQEDTFWSEFAQGYLEVEVMEKTQRLRDFSKAYDEIDDKESFNAQYLKVLMENLEEEL